MAITVDITIIFIVVLLAYIFGIWTTLAMIRYTGRPPYGPYW